MWHKALKQAVETYGVQSQMIIAVEEMSELTKEISKNIRGQDNLDHMAEEIADVEIMLEQLKIAFDLHTKVDLWYGKKLKRLDERLEAGQDG